MKKFSKKLVLIILLGYLSSFSGILAEEEASIPVEYNQKASQALENDSNADAEADKALSDENGLLDDIIDIRPLEAWNPWWKTDKFLISLAVIALLILVIILFRKYLNRKRRGVSVLPQSPYDVAMSAIEASRIILSEKNQKKFAIILSDAVRQYMSTVFNLPAPEYTTEEVLEKICDKTLFNDEFIDEIKPFLQNCDLAKFTKQAFNLAALEMLYEQAHKIVFKADQLRQNQQMAATNDVVTKTN